MTTPLRCLLVEDSEDDAQLVLRELRVGGFDVTSERVETPEAMHAALDRQPWDLVISDFQMPRFSGPAALKLLQACGQDVPFIIVSGAIGEETAVEMIRAGANDYLMKGRLARLVPAVQRELQDAAERREAKRVDAALSDSVSRNAAILMSAMDGFWLVDMKGRLLESNAAYARMSGYSVEELTGMRVSDLEATDSAEEIAERIAKLRQLGEARFESRHRRKDGSVFDVEVSIQYRADHDGILVAFLHDITARRRAEAALRESEAILDLFIQHSPMYTYIKEVTSNASRVLHASDNFQQMIGIPGREMTGKTMAELFPPELAAKLYADDWHVVSKGEVLQLEEELNGRYYATIKFPIVRGNRTLLAGYSIDITERKAAEEILHNMALMVETAPNAISVHDFDGRFFYANVETFAMHGYSRDEFLALNLRQLDVPGDERLMAGRMQELHERGEASFEVAHFRKDGSTLPLHVTAKVTRWGGADAILSVATDISARKQAEATEAAMRSELVQSQKMEAVGLLAGGIAHDFNNMLAAILGYAELTIHTLGDGHAATPYVEEIRTAAQRSANLTRQLLTFARKQVVELKALDINATIAGCLEMLHRMLGERVVLEWVPDRAAWNIEADATQIEQALTNLAINARDAARGHGVLLEVSTSNVLLDASFVASHQGVKAGEFVRLRVRDTGSGMDAQTLSHIFEPFFTTKKLGEGTGLGLSTVFGIVQQCGGSIDVESTLGVGTTFDLYFPRVHTPVAEKPDPEAPLQRGTETILLAEDQKQVRTTITKILQILGYTVLAAQNGDEAVRLAASCTGRIHLLLTDVILPGTQGTELYDALVQKLPNLKVLFMSGYAGDVIAKEGILDAGIHFLHKPFSMTSLSFAVREVLDG